MGDYFKEHFSGLAEQHFAAIREMTPEQKIQEMRDCLLLIVHEASRVDRVTTDSAPIQWAVRLLHETAK